MRWSHTLPLLLGAAFSSCASYRIEIEPASPPLSLRLASDRPVLTIEVQSTYAPYVDGALSTTDLYPRDQGLGRQDSSRYRDALARTHQFANVELGAAGDGLHCRLTVVSGREPADSWRRTISILFTLGQLSHEQREIVQLAAAVSAPGRGEKTYRLEAKVTTDAVAADDTRLRRPWTLLGPENDLCAALVGLLVSDGWLDRTGGAQ